MVFKKMRTFVIDLVPDKCSLCKNNRVLPPKDTANFSACIPKTFLQKIGFKNNEKKNIKLCPTCAIKLEKSKEFKEQAEKNAKRTNKGTRSNECFFCESDKVKLVNVASFYDKIEEFCEKDSVKEHVICLNCLFELDLWCEMGEMLKSWKQDERSSQKRDSADVTMKKSPKTSSDAKKSTPLKTDDHISPSAKKSPSTVITQNTAKSSGIKKAKRNKLFSKNHLNEKKLSLSQYTCNICNESFALLHKYQKHLSTHSKEKSVIIQLFRHQDLPETVRASEFLKEKIHRNKNIEQKASPTKTSKQLQKKLMKNNENEENKLQRKRKRQESDDKEEDSKDGTKKKDSPRVQNKNNITTRKKEEKFKSPPVHVKRVKKANGTIQENKSENRSGRKRKREDSEEMEEKKSVTNNQNSVQLNKDQSGKAVSQKNRNTRIRIKIKPTRRLQEHKLQEKTRRYSKSSKKMVETTKHNKRNNEEEPLENKCTTCNETFRVLHEYKKHLLTHNSKIDLVVNLMKHKLPDSTNASEFVLNYSDKFTNDYRSKTLADALLKKYIGEENLRSLGLDSYVEDKAPEEKLDTPLTVDGEDDKNEEQEQSEIGTSCRESKESTNASPAPTAVNNQVELEEESRNTKETQKAENRSQLSEELAPQFEEIHTSHEEPPAVTLTETGKSADDDTAEHTSDDGVSLNQSDVENEKGTGEVTVNKNAEIATHDSDVKELLKVQFSQESELSDIIEATPEELIPNEKSTQITSRNGTHDVTEETVVDKTAEIVEDISSITNFIRETMNSPFEVSTKTKNDEHFSLGSKKKVRFTLESEDDSNSVENNDLSLLMSAD